MERSSSAAQSQAAADGDDEAVYIRLCLNEVLFGQLHLPNCSGGGLSWCLPRLGSLFVLLSWFEGQEVFVWRRFAQTKSC